MFKIDAEGIVISIVEAMLPRGTPGRALYVPLELRLGNLETGTQTVHVAIFVYRPRSYTLVATRSDHLRVWRRQSENFTMEAYHDSVGWRSGVEGVFQNAYRALQGALPDTKKPLAATARFPITSGFGVHEVTQVDFDSTDYDKPVVVTWKGGHD